jgi:hypothetical protein
MMELRILRGLLRVVKETPISAAKTGSPVIDQEKVVTLSRRTPATAARLTPGRRWGWWELAFQAYQFVLDAVRLTECRRQPASPADGPGWRVTRLMQGEPGLGR